MNPMTPTNELLAVAERVVWFKEPSDTLDDPIHFLAYAMKLGTADDLIELDKAGISLGHFKEVLKKAPPGIFDDRSWAYWNLRCGRTPVPPLPMRNLDAD